ncbi:signal recognition particle-docking protein FtsY [Candidatus Berkiella aquae]|uniref:Signal recognition particle receptor FtsY n=1 Tax=Candidatus Berkiella aquae TaxID=295108 RepID=A0A0Q9YIB1_9GAMM|nr:signal recognition particle-docking protein FtsY [Candidatus Berkiella aquae]MCS5709837.1 signal recognition particle-docking protein FtsY [Candidatus Berkiella aquae]
MLRFFRRKKDDGSSPKDPNDSSDKTPSLEGESAVECPSESDNPLPAGTLPDIKEEAPQEVAKQTEESAQAPASTSWFSRLKSSLSRTRSSLTEGLASLFLGKKEIDDDLLEQIETQLLTADVGVEATQLIIEKLTKGISRKELNDPQAVYRALQKALTDMLLPCEQPLTMGLIRPFVILMIGVNGAGKTTTIGKLAKKCQKDGYSVMLAAGDTFRAAAIEQLSVWGERNQVPVTAQHTGADSASVIFDAFQSAKAKQIDVLIADTAGRLHTRDNLMDELKKVKRVLQKLDPNAPHEVLLVLDASQGQNALAQAQKFHEVMGVTGIALTKLDGTAKGGIIFAIANKLNLPIRFIGVGEKVDDLRPFEANAFVNALFDSNANEE